MKDKGQTRRDEVVLTARVDRDLHSIAKTKMIARRESFQDVITAAIEEYAKSPKSEGIGARADPAELIAALHKELIHKKSDDILTTPSANALHELKIYLRDIREMLDKIDRVIVKTTTGGQVAEPLGSNMHRSDKAIERESVSETGNIINSERTGERDTDHTEETRQLIEQSGRARERASENLRTDVHPPARRTATRKKAG